MGRHRQPLVFFISFTVSGFKNLPKQLLQFLLIEKYDKNLEFRAMKPKSPIFIYRQN